MSDAEVSASKHNFQVLIVEDDPFFRRVIADSLARIDHNWHLIMVGSAIAAEEIIARDEVDVGLALVDLGLPDGDGLDVIHRLRETCPEARILVISASVEEHRVLDAIRAGAAGYITKGDAHLSIKQAVQQVMDGMHPLSAQLAGYFLKLVERDKTTVHDDNRKVMELTYRERELLEFFSRGATYRDASVSMGITLATVQTHARNLFRKLGVHSGLQALAKARQQGIL